MAMSDPEDLPKKNLIAIAPQFLVADVARSAEYYRDKLGFTIGPYSEDPPVFVIVERDGIRLQLSVAENGSGGPNRQFKDVALDAYLWVNDVEALYQEFSAAGATITTTPVIRFYGIKEIEIQDPDGYVLCFGEAIWTGGVEHHPDTL